MNTDCVKYQIISSVPNSTVLFDLMQTMDFCLQFVMTKIDTSDVTDTDSSYPWVVLSISKLQFMYNGIILVLILISQSFLTKPPCMASTVQKVSNSR